MEQPFRKATFRTDVLEPFEIGALILAILAFPSVSEEARSLAVAEAYCADTVRVTCENNPDEAEMWTAQYSAYAAISAAESHRRKRTIGRRWQDRMVASRMSLGFLKEGLTGEEMELPPGMTRHSINQLCELVLADSRESVAENIEKRSWRESRPVIHLASAVQIELRIRHGLVGVRSAPYPLDDLALHLAVLRRAQLHEAIVLLDPRFGRSRDRELIRLRIDTSG